MSLKQVVHNLHRNSSTEFRVESMWLVHRLVLKITGNAVNGFIAVNNVPFTVRVFYQLQTFYDVFMVVENLGINENLSCKHLYIIYFHA